MINTSDGGFLVAGYANNALTTFQDIEAIKFDSGGNIEWVGLYQGSSTDFGFAAAKS